MTFYESFWEKGLEPELIYFFNKLNWTYIIMFVVILYGLKHTTELDWFTNLCAKFKIERFKTWIAAAIIGGLFCFFRWKDPTTTFNSEYIAALLRSVFFAVVFSGIFVDIPVVIIKRLGKIIDSKGDKEKENKKENNQ